MMVPPRIRRLLQSKPCQIVLWVIAIPILFTLAIILGIYALFVVEAVMPSVLFATIGAIGIEQVKELLTPPYRED